MFNVFKFVMLRSHARQTSYTLARKHQSLFRTIAGVVLPLSFLPLFLFPSYYALFYAFVSELDCTPLQYLQMLISIKPATGS
jgi:hypothetical protein